MKKLRRIYNTMEKLLKILNELKPGIDFETETDLIGRGILTSFDIIRLVVEFGYESYYIEGSKYASSDKVGFGFKVDSGFEFVQNF